MARPRICGIYKILRIGTTHCYVGQSYVALDRLSRHRTELRAGTHHASRLQRAWNKYDESAFSFEIIEECAEHDLTVREQWWMNALDSVYNSCPAAGSPRGFKHTDETRAKVSAALMGHPSYTAGMKHSDETKAKMSASRMGNKSTTGHKDSDETRAKKRRAGLLRHHPPDVVEELMQLPYKPRFNRKKPEGTSHGNTGKPKPPEVREKIRQSHLARIERLKSEES